jgi:hypothetical protein
MVAKAGGFFAWVYGVSMSYHQSFFFAPLKYAFRTNFTVISLIAQILSEDFRSFVLFMNLEYVFRLHS